LLAVGAWVGSAFGAGGLGGFRVWCGRASPPPVCGGREARRPAPAFHPAERTRAGVELSGDTVRVTGTVTWPGWVISAHSTSRQRRVCAERRIRVKTARPSGGARRVCGHDPTSRVPLVGGRDVAGGGGFVATPAGARPPVCPGVALPGLWELGLGVGFGWGGGGYGLGWWLVLSSRRAAWASSASSGGAWCSARLKAWAAAAWFPSWLSRRPRR
jgi:hypothetical protein